MKRLAIITTHPIQYYAPVFKLLANRSKINIKVFYTWGETAQQKFDPGFGKAVNWDLPLSDGYEYKWVLNTSRQPGSHNFTGIVNPYLVQDIKAYKAEAILVFGWAYHGHLSVIRHFSGKLPVYFRGDSTLLDLHPGAKNVIRSMVLKWLYKHVDHAFYPGTQSKVYFKKFGLKDNQLSFAPHAVDNNRFAHPRAAEAQRFREKLNVKTDDTLVLFAGKFEQKKDPLTLLKAFVAINQSNTHLLFVGNGVLEADLKHHADGIENIHFVDFVNQTDMPVIYQACNLFCLPSKGPGETWGLAVNEAMACGKAVLVSDKVGCATDLVKPDINGEVFQAGNLSSLIEKLEKMLSSQVNLNAYGVSSASIIKDWNFTNIAEAIESKILHEKV